MKKKILFLGVLAVVLLMVSSATAVPQTQSIPVMEKVSEIEVAKLAFKEKIESFKDKLDTLILPKEDPNSLIDLLIYLFGFVAVIFWALWLPTLGLTGPLVVIFSALALGLAFFQGVMSGELHIIPPESLEGLEMWLNFLKWLAAKLNGDAL